MVLTKQAFHNALQAIGLLSMLAALYAIFVYAPVEKSMGLVQKIFYLHVPAAFLAFFAFFITFVASLLYLVKKDLKWDRLASCSVEIGVVFCTIVLVTGPIWAKPVWNVWWTWDPRLTTTLILWFIYLAYLVLRKAAREHQRANFSAVFGIIGFVNVPLTFFAIRLWRTIHPVLITARGINISAPMKHTLALSFSAFFLLFFLMLTSRLRLEESRANLEASWASIEDAYFRLHLNREGEPKK